MFEVENAIDTANEIDSIDKEIKRLQEKRAICLKDVNYYISEYVKSGEFIKDTEFFRKPKPEPRFEGDTQPWWNQEAWCKNSKIPENIKAQINVKYNDLDWIIVLGGYKNRTINSHIKVTHQYGVREGGVDNLIKSWGKEVKIWS